MATPRIEFVYGFHGCAREVADAVLHADGVSLTSSENDYDWLGSGIYFWESAPVRAMEWASKKFDHSHIQVSVRNPKAIVSLFPVEVPPFGILSV